MLAIKYDMILPLGGLIRRKASEPVAFFFLLLFSIRSQEIFVKSKILELFCCLNEIIRYLVMFYFPLVEINTPWLLHVRT